MTKSYEIGSGEPWPPPKETRAKPKADWRAIPLIEVDWQITGCTGHVCSTLFNHSRPPHDPRWPEGHEWTSLTLGDLADMGEREWLRATSVGAVTVSTIKEIIDRAAAGEDVTVKDAGTHSYTPRPWPRSQL